MKNKSKNHKHKAWYAEIRGSYIPISWQGALTYIPMIVFLITVMVYSLNRADSVLEGIYLMFPYFVCTGVVMHWFAKYKS